jgi:TolB-like protein
MGDADSHRTVFLSYARADQDQAARLAEALEAAGLAVWWDKLIQGGAPFAESIETSLDSCDAVVVCWSRGSVKSDWVLDEAGRGRDLHKLVPVTLDGSEPPLGFRQYHAIDLSRWSEPTSKGLVAAIIRGVEAVAGRSVVTFDHGDNRRSEEKPRVAASGVLQPPVRRYAKAIVAAGITLVAIALGFLVYERFLGVGSNSAAGDTPSIAVLPFENLSGDPNNEYLGDGLSEELLHRLANIPGLQVAARTSSASFKDREETAQNIGEMLGVTYLLEGSVRRAGDTLRVAAQLIDARSGYHLWSETFDRQFSDILTIQDEISLAVLKGIDVPLIDKVRAAAIKHVTSSPEALELYLQARRADREWGLEQNDRAIELYERAIALDPNFAAAYAAMANSLINRVQVVGLSFRDPALAPVPALAQKAVELDPESGEARALLGKVLYTRFDFQGAERELQKAASLSRNSTSTLENLWEYYGNAGWPPEKVIEYAERWVKLDPLNWYPEWALSVAQFHVHRYEDGLRTVKRVLEHEPDQWIAQFNHTGVLLELGRYDEAIVSARREVELHDAQETRSDLICALALAGQVEEARRHLAVLLDPAQTPYYAPSWRATAFACLNDVEAALSALERARDERDFWTIGTLHFRLLTPLHREPRFQAVVRQFGQERRVAYLVEQTRHLPPWPYSRSTAVDPLRVAD